MLSLTEFNLNPSIKRHFPSEARRIVVKWTVLMSGLLLLVGLLTSCRSENKSEDRTKLFIALGSEPTTLDPVKATDTNSMRLTALVFQSFVRLGPELQIEGDAAETWSLFPNKIELIIKPGLKFSNGRAITKEDIDFSIDQFRSKTSPFSGAFSIIENHEVLDHEDARLRVILFLNKPSFKLLTADLPVVKILPKKEYLEDPSKFARQPIGSGPLKLLHWTEDQLVFERNLYANNFNIEIKAFYFQVIRDEFTRFQKMLKGSLDIAQTEISPLKIQEFQKKPNQFDVFVYPGLSTTYLLINFQSPWLKKLPSRQLILSAINKEEIIKYKLNDLGVPAKSILTPQNSYFDSKFFVGLEAPNNLDRKQFESVSFKPLTFKTSNNQSAIDVGRVLTNQMRKLDIQIDMQSYEWGTFYQDIQKGRFDLALMRWTGVLDPDIFRMAFHSEEWPPGRNRGRYSNPSVDELLNQAENAKSLDQRRSIFGQIQRKVLEDIAYIPLWYDLQTAVINRRVKGYKPWISSDFFSFLEVTKSQGDKNGSAN